MNSGITFGMTFGYLTTVALIAAAGLTSALSAVIGMGGGMILLAIMLLFMPVEVAIPIHAAVQLISNGTRTFVYLKHVQWKVWALFCGPAVIGILMGKEIFLALDRDWLRIGMALFILITTYLPKSKKGNPWPLWPFAIAGAIAGTLGMLVGATGPIIAPFFLHAQLLKEKLIATKAVCQTTIHILKIVAFGTMGFAFGELSWLIVVLGVAVIVGTFLGKKFLQRISEQTFVYLVKAVLTVIAVKLIVYP